MMLRGAVQPRKMEKMCRNMEEKKIQYCIPKTCFDIMDVYY